MYMYTYTHACINTCRHAHSQTHDGVKWYAYTYIHTATMHHTKQRVRMFFSDVCSHQKRAPAWSRWVRSRVGKGGCFIKFTRTHSHVRAYNARALEHTYQYTYKHAHTHKYTHTHTCADHQPVHDWTHSRACIYVYVCVCVHIHINVYIYIYALTDVYICIHIYTFIYICVFIYMYMHIYIYIYKYINIYT